MLRITLWLLVGVFAWGFASCSVTCPDGNVCSDLATCCKTKHGYSCCPYPNAVCCSDLAHCCPSGYRCNLVTQMCEKEPWMKIPMVTKEAAEEPSTPVLPAFPIQELENNHVPEQKKSSVVYCDIYNTCPDGTTCCRHPTGVWFCCVYNHGRCCLDGFHCCPYGYDCDLTYQHCIRQGLRYPFSPKQSVSSVPASRISPSEDQSTLLQKPMTALTEASGGNTEVGVVRCDNYFICPDRTTCCRHPAGVWFCCPVNHGRCCRDGFHCCPYGYDCDLTYQHCIRQGLIYPFSPKQSLSSVPASRISTSEDQSTLLQKPMTALTEASGGNAEVGVIRCDPTFFCSPGTTCCKDPNGRWTCCPYPLGQCCADGRHCCEYGYTCDSTSLSCSSGYSQIPSGAQEDVKTV